MKNIMLLTLAGLLGLIAMAGEATAQTDDVVVDGRIITGENFTSAAMPTDQKTGVVQEAYGDALGRKAGGKAQDFHRPGTDKAQDFHFVPTDQTDQRGGYVQDAYGDVLGRKAGDEQAKGGLAKVGTGQLVLPAQNTYGGLNNLNSVNGLFANSKGGDQGNGLLLPAVRGAGGTQQAHGAGGGSAGKVQMQDFHFSPNTGADSLASAHGAGGGAGKTLDSKAINFTKNANTAGGGPHVSPGTAKGLNFTNTAKK